MAADGGAYDRTVVDGAQLEAWLLTGWERDPDRPGAAEGDRYAIWRRRVGSPAPVRQRRG
jgi:hypothetical protein